MAVNFNQTTVLAGSGSGGPNNGIVEMVVEDFVPVPQNRDNSNTSFAALSGIAQQNFTAPADGNYLFDWNFSSFDQGNDGDVQCFFRIVVDAGTGNEQILGDSDTWRTYLGAATEGDSVQSSFQGVANLSAGAHTIDLECKVSGATPVMRRNSNNPMFLSVSLPGNIATLKEVIEWIPGGVASTTSGTLGDITGVTNQAIDVFVDGDYIFDLDVNGVYNNAVGRTDWVFAVIVDDTTTYEFPVMAVAIGTLDSRKSVSGKVKVPLTAGVRNVRIQWRRAGGVNTMFVDTASSLSLSII